MTASQPPLLFPLSSTDASAQISLNGFSVLAAVNGPLEVQRRDELAEEALLEVNIRPVNGSGGVRERHLETLVHDVLREIILVTAHPKTLVQIIIQFLAIPAEIPDHQSSSYLSSLPAILQAAHLAFLQSSLPLRSTLSSHLIAVPQAETLSSLIADPTPQQISTAKSLHAFAFSMPNKEMIMLESEGKFSMAQWNEAVEVAKGRSDADEEKLKVLLAARVAEEESWRGG